MNDRHLPLPSGLTQASDRVSTGEGASLGHIVAAFEEAWQRGDRPALAEFLPSSDPGRRIVLVELVHADLELRLKEGEAVGVEFYLERYPELAADREVVLALLSSEFGLRRRQNPNLDASEYYRRFPHLRDELSRFLGTLVRKADTDGGPDAPHGEGPADSGPDSPTVAGGTPVPAAATAATLPQVPGYEIQGVLGRGAMGVVYRARHVRLNRLVALKMILGGAHASAEQRERFLIEARAVARLQHPNIVQIHDVGEHEGRPFFSLELVGGGSLDRYLAGVPQAARASAELVASLAQAMESAHAAGVVHRDLKPANILLAVAGSPPTDGVARLPGPGPLIPKITDFGLAKQLDDESGQTQSGAILGTPCYMSPEQAAGRGSAVGPAADVYALGAILYQMLTGRPPFQGPTVLDTLQHVRTQEPVPPRSLQPGVPRDLELICLKCLQKEPRHRYASASQLAEELRRFLAGEPLAVTRPVGAGERLWRWCRRNPPLAGALGLVALLLVAVTAVSIHSAVTSVRDTADLRKKEEEARQARKDAERNAQEASKNRDLAERQSVELLLDKGLALCEQGEVAAGLLWLGRGLELADRSGAGEDLKHVLRCNLAMWGREVRPLQGILLHRAGHMAAVLDPEGGHPGVGGNPRPWTLGQRAIAFAPNGKTVATAQGKQVRLWDVASGEAVGTPLEHSETLLAVAFSKDGRTLLAGAGPSVHFWDPAGSKPRASGTHARDVTAVAFSSDGVWAATASLDGTVKRWDAASFREVGEPLRTGSPVRDLAFSPDGKLLLTGSENRALQLWDVGTGKPVGEPMQASSDLCHIAFAPDGKTCAGAWDGGRLWEVPSGRLIPGPLVQNAPGPIFAMAYRPDGKALLTTNMGGALRLWEAPSGKLLRDQPQKDGLLAVGFTPDGRAYFASGAEGKVRFHDTATGQPVGAPVEHSVSVLHTACSPDGQTLLTWDKQGVVRLWGAASRGPQHRPLPAVAGARLTAFSPDGRNFAAATEVVRLYDAESGKSYGKSMTQDGPVTALVYRPDGKVLLTGGGKSARLWDATSGEPLGPPMPQEAPISSARWTGDGSTVLLTSGGVGRRWNATSGEAIGPALSLGMAYTLTDDGRLLRATSSRVTITMQDAVTGKDLGKEVRQPGFVGAMVFASDGQFLAACGEEASVYLWSPPTGKPFGPPLRHREIVRSLLLSPDDRRLLTAGVSGGPQQAARLWDTSRCAAVGAPIPGVTAMAFSGDARLALTASGRSFRAWDATTGKSLGPPVTGPAPIAGLLPSRDGSVVRTANPEGREWDLAPLPIRGSAERVNCWLHVSTGMMLDGSGEARTLDAAEWKSLRDRLRALGGPPEIGTR